MSKAQAVCKVSEGDAEAPVHKIQGIEVRGRPQNQQEERMGVVYLIIASPSSLSCRAG